MHSDLIELLGSFLPSSIIYSNLNGEADFNEMIEHKLLLLALADCKSPSVLPSEAVTYKYVT